MIQDGIYKTFWDRPGRETTWFETPAVMSEWDHAFPRFTVRYSGWSCAKSMDLRTKEVAEPVVAAKMAQCIADGHPDWWVRIEDAGSARYPHWRAGAEFYALDGRKGFIAIRQRYSASVQWLGEGEPLGLTFYALDNMRAQPPAPPAPVGSTWLRP
ncbi:hypothetical protein K388_07481 [Streptomyces sp. KhCrAH-43]|uniref:hypothetical protein n=1 Tax=unclassified Streptomyces TaxID=2593676 RepID=UPI000477A30A|nr:MULTISPECIES: hypothetical protein [unclassified Streptomyces]MYS37191.1 hypothetical protein [Streptomyces sp. SID4920]MYX67168.1 hypothetical protein [Streptomyces sp. SID8373]RAJ42581.1 hypothetical protein K388_07481 [Streptomyces sp. KhCrAH-43]